ncbi:MAG: hypothetical protein AAFP84_21405 [Actinomycetota bacterium]
MPEHTFVTSPLRQPDSPLPSAAERSAGSATRRRTAPIADGSRIVLRPWVDPIVDERGHDPRSRYVERFWLGVLGPSATWLLRRFTDELAAGSQRPDESTSLHAAEVDLVELARSMGMSYVPGRSSAFARAIQRCVMFGVAHQTGDGLAVRRRLPDVADRHLRRLPPGISINHDRWLAESVTLDDLSRGHRLGLAMLEVGDEPDQIERQLVAIGVGATAAGQIADNLTRLAGSIEAATDTDIATGTAAGTGPDAETEADTAAGTATSMPAGDVSPSAA